MSRPNNIFLPILIILSFSELPALAKWGTFSITDNSGDQVLVKHGLFGKKTVVKDRNGNGFKHSKSIFGLTNDTQVGVLGNEAHVHKGLFGFGKTEGHDVLGDTVSSKKNPLYKNTNINLSGANAFLGKVFSPKSPAVQPIVPPTVSPSAIAPSVISPQTSPQKTYDDPTLPSMRN